MTNKFRGLDLVPGNVEARDHIPVGATLDKGIALHMSPRDIQLNQSPDLDGVRVDQGGLRQDHGLVTLGTAAAVTVLSLGEHRFVLTDLSIFSRIFRLFRQADTFIRIESWDDVAWNVEYDADNWVVDPVLLSYKSFFGAAYFADGSRVFKWVQVTSTVPQSDEFTAANALVAVNDTVSAVIIPAAAAGGSYDVHYSLTISGPCQAGSSVVVAVLDDAAVEIAEISHPIPADSSTSRVYTLAHEIATVLDTIASGEDLTLQLKAITAVATVRQYDMSIAMFDSQYTKIEAREAVNDQYTFSNFDIEYIGGGSEPGVNLEFYYDTGAGWVLWDDSISYTEASSFGATNILNQFGLGAGDDFRVFIPVADQGNYIFSFTPVISWNESFIEEVSVHGFNLATDGDASQGVTYQTEGTPVNEVLEIDVDPSPTPTVDSIATSGGVNTLTDTTLSETVNVHADSYLTIDGGTGIGQIRRIQSNTATVFTLDEDWGTNPDATSTYTVHVPVLVNARFLGIFDDRLIVLRLGGDPQTIGWSRSGLPEDHVGAGSSAGLILPSDSDPIDELMGFGRISSNVGALFRRRSIMRVTPTGLNAQALGFRKWLEELGTESPFSLAEVVGGIIFLGSDRQAYYLTDSGPVPISEFIQDELAKTIGDLGVVEGVYDQSSQNYLMAVPGLAGSNTAVTWIFDFARFLATQETIWFKRVEVMNRLAFVAGTDLIFAGSDNNVREYDKTAYCGGQWISPMLNRMDTEKEFDLATVTIRYEALAATTIVIEGSGDGGNTWVAGRKATVSLAATNGEERRAVQSFEVSGYDTRFRITYPTDTLVTIKKWQVDLVERGDDRSE